MPLFNQAGEASSDSAGAYNSLDAGRVRRPQYEWSENGGVTLLDFFARLERAAGQGGPLSLLNPVNVLKSHPNPLARIPLAMQVAAFRADDARVDLVVAVGAPSYTSGSHI